MTSLLGPLVGEPPRPGVYRLPGRAVDIAAALRAAGWHTAVVSATSSKAGFYAGTARALGFPSHFGANLDALWDSLTDLERPTVLVLPEWRTLARAAPEDWAAILAVLTERTRTTPAFAVVLGGRGTPVAPSSGHPADGGVG